MPHGGRHAPYGTACANCSRAKCRCVGAQAGGPCERCRRLGKECVAVSISRKRAPRRLDDVRTSQLEKKIDGLVSLLTSTGRRPDDAVLSTSDVDTCAVEPLGSAGRNATPSSLDLLLDLAPADDAILSEFRTLKLPYFPIVYIPPLQSASELRLARPFLWLCVVAVSTRSTLKQSQLYADIRRHLGSEMVGELAKGIDLLLGLLVCIAWGNFQVKKRPFFTLFTQLASSIVFDLGLNETVPTGPSGKGSKYRFHKPWLSPTRTMEERRAVLGCWFISSVLSCFLGRIDTLRWTSHMSECMQELSQTRESEGDLVLVALIRVQRLVDRASRFLRDGDERQGDRPKEPDLIYSEVYKAELEDLRGTMSPETVSQEVVSLHIRYAQAMIYKHALPGSERLTRRLELGLIERLCALIDAMRSYFEVLLTIHPRQYIGFSSPVLFQMMHCVISLYRVTATEIPGWDRESLAKLADVTTLGKTLAQNLSDVADAVGIVADGPDCLFTSLASIVDSVEKEVKAQSHDYLSGIRLLSLVVSTTIVGFLMLMDSSIISTAIPHLTSEFHSLLDVGWYGAAYQLANASFQPMAGTMYTHLSSKWTFVAFFSVFELGSLLCGLASSSSMLIVARAVEGIGASGLQNGMLTIMVGCVPIQKRPALMGVGMGFSQLGLVLGPVIGGLLTEYASWRWCFYINLPVGALAMVLFLGLRVPDHTPKSRGIVAARVLSQNLDLLGFAFFAGSAIQLLLALQYGGNEYSWRSPVVIGLFSGAGATVCIFAFVEHRKGPGAILPLVLIRRRFVCLSGVYLLPTIISQVVFVVLSGSILGKTGYCLPFSILGAVLLAIGGGLISTYQPTTSPSQWIGYQIILGAGRGLGMQMPALVAQALLPRQDIAIATSFLMLGHTFGGAVSLSVAQTIFNSLRSGIAKFAPHANVDRIIAAGAAGLRSRVSAENLPGVLRAYVLAVDRVFYFTAAAAVCSFVFAWGLGWRDIRKKPQER
ncbi:MFS multidrug transporter [Pleurostoma richardsiae]|uniref:MFS multidrug transporter n=1 Tax=Pleurostoma richardsiae TaxID=41990 RepID=A0AA38RRS7_9PEZI|nr:MFS multidrug transporter [Pleurostoma richardsiae]